jgi:exodeoxyribonuclease VII large subunit
MNLAKSIPSVSELTWHIKDVLEGEFSDVRVSGEVSKPLRSSNGHLYFTLKDDGAAISCVAWKSTVDRFKLDVAHGQQINVSGDVQVFAPRGQYQIIVKSVEQAGEGALQLAYEKLKAKLKEEGLFDESLKKSLPEFPKIIGVVTSETGAAFQDIRSTLEKRYPLARVLLFHAAVQGVAAAGEIARGIHWFNEQKAADVLIIGRGGGSLEDLWPFNEEVVARAISNCEIPVISAVGHETDFSISDFVADVRAATPTQAAVLATPDVNDLRLSLDGMVRQAERSILQRISQSQVTITRMLKSHALLVVTDKIRAHKEAVKAHGFQINSLVRNRLSRLSDHVQSLTKSTRPTLQLKHLNLRNRVDLLKRNIGDIEKDKVANQFEIWQRIDFRLQKINPTEPLNRGFTRITQTGQWIRTKNQMDESKEFEIHWKDGVLLQNPSTNTSGK